MSASLTATYVSNSSSAFRSLRLFSPVSVQQYLNPEAEHYLDWFHITMRVTVMGQYAKGLDTTQENRQEILKSLESVKHYLWHGNVARARDRIEDIHCFLDNEEPHGCRCHRRKRTSHVGSSASLGP